MDDLIIINIFGTHSKQEYTLKPFKHDANLPSYYIVRDLLCRCICGIEV